MSGQLNANFFLRLLRRAQNSTLWSCFIICVACILIVRSPQADPISPMSATSPTVSSTQTSNSTTNLPTPNISPETAPTAVSASTLQQTPVELTSVTGESASNGDIQLVLTFSGPISTPRSFSMDNPPRMVLDFDKVKSSLKDNKSALLIGVVQGYEAVQSGARLRVVFNLKQNATYSLSTSGNVLKLTLSALPTSVTSLMAKTHFSANVWNNKVHSVNGIDFHRDESGNGRVVVTLSDASMAINVDNQGGDIVVDFLNTTLPSQLQRKLEVTDFGTPVDTVTTKNVGGNVQMTIASHGDVDTLTYQVNKQFIIDIAPKSPELTQDDTKVIYMGEKLSFNFQDIPVRAVLQLLADFTGINIVASDSVKGNITLRLNNVPWDEAMAIILRTQGLGQRKLGSAILIAPSEEIAVREKAELESRKEVKELEPLLTELIQLNYAKAADISSLLKAQTTSLLSARGNVNTDVRTNTILVQDTESSLANLRPLIEKLDVPVRQVLIEARIVEVDTNFAKDLGIQFGLTKPTHLSGTLTGANTINNNAIANKNAGTPTLNPLQDVSFTDRLNVNLPATPSAGTPASIALALASLGEGVLLDLEISALESEGLGQIVASPRLVTANQQEAVIEQGEEIPYQQSTSSGATSVEFKKAVLSLRVTPQITPDGSIIMVLKINQDKRSAQPEVQGVPAIDTESIETNVLVENGQTIVLGGIYKEDKEHRVFRVPFLGNLPAVGHFFKNTQDTDTRSELLIFITPRIVQQTPLN